MIRPLLTRMFSPAAVEALFEWYHFLWALVGALVYRFPSRKLVVIGVTGTKGKSSVVSILAAILAAAGEKVASTSTIAFTIDGAVERNRYKMSMPGRMFMQQFLRRAVHAGCRYAVIEMTSEGARYWRHACIAMDVFIFTNLSPEHIESHGSFEKYRDAKLRLRDALARSTKPNRAIISNLDDPHGELFLSVLGVTTIGYRLADAKPYSLTESGITCTIAGTVITSPLRGEFNLYNIIAAASAARHLGIPDEAISRGLATLSTIRERAELVSMGQPFLAVVDYAHTKESLEALYHAFADRRKICVLGNTGGGRDRWKRPLMAHTAETYCDEVILTNEDP